MVYIYKDRLIALAGLFQAAALVENLATKGTCDQQALQVSITSIFQRNPQTAEDVFGSVQSLNLGVKHLEYFLKKEISTLRATAAGYGLSLIQVTYQLMKKPKMLEFIGQEINDTVRQLGYFDVVHDNIVSRLALIYQKTLSTFQKRIRIIGEADYLHSRRIIDKIRVLLLAGVRAVILWRQVGGRCRQLIFTRARLLEALHTVKSP